MGGLGDCSLPKFSNVVNIKKQRFTVVLEFLEKIHLVPPKFQVPPKWPTHLRPDFNTLYLWSGRKYIFSWFNNVFSYWKCSFYFSTLILTEVIEKIINTVKSIRFLKNLLFGLLKNDPTSWKNAVVLEQQSQFLLNWDSLCLKDEP